jgi:hypothetical protein
MATIDVVATRDAQIKRICGLVDEHGQDSGGDFAAQNFVFDGFGVQSGPIRGSRRILGPTFPAKKMRLNQALLGKGGFVAGVKKRSWKTPLPLRHS